MRPRHFQSVLVDNRNLGADTFVLALDSRAVLCDFVPGQFVMLRSPSWGSDPLLARAFSLLDADGSGVFSLLGRGTGKATSRMAEARPGMAFSIVGPLGRGFSSPRADEEVWLVAGGVGVAPLYAYARRNAETTPVTLFYGGRSVSDLVLCEALEAWTAELHLSTDDGSIGTQGTVIDAVRAELERRPGLRPRVLACGPDAMLRAVATIARDHGLEGEISVEGEMACGIGACLACAIPCTDRPFRYACVDGPVFDLGQLAGEFAGT